MSYMSAYSTLGASPCVVSFNLPIRLDDGTGGEVVLASFFTEELIETERG